MDSSGLFWPGSQTLSINGSVRYGGTRPAPVLATISTNPSKIIHLRGLAKLMSRYKRTGDRLVLDRARNPGKSSGRPPESPRNSDKPSSATRPVPPRPTTRLADDARTDRPADAPAARGRSCSANGQQALGAEQLQVPAPACSFARRLFDRRQRPATARQDAGVALPAAPPFRPAPRRSTAGRSEPAVRGRSADGRPDRVRAKPAASRRRQLSLGRTAQIGRKLFPGSLVAFKSSLERVAQRDCRRSRIALLLRVPPTERSVLNAIQLNPS